MHRPVLLDEVIKIFKPQSGETYIDATVNGGGHAEAIAERVGPSGKVIGIDWDCDLLEKLKSKRQNTEVQNIILLCDNYANLPSICRKYNLGKVNGIVFDLGFSSFHPEESRRGFSFLKDESLDMRYNKEKNELTAGEIINKWKEGTIDALLHEFGGERFARRIARGIIRRRAKKRIQTTRELVATISESVPHWYLRGKIHPATKTFQALRIAVNYELENVERGIRAAIEVLLPGGKIIVISFHSLEDRISKNIFKEFSKKTIVRVLTGKPITASLLEVKENPRARSARLRAAEKI